MKSKLLFFTFFAAVFAAPMAFAATSIYVSPEGNDANPGISPDKPFKTIERARNAVRGRFNKNMKEDFIVYLRGGRYEIDETLLFDERDSGSDGHNIIYRAYEKEEPVVSGGRRVTGWEPVPRKPYFVASVPRQKPVKPGKGLRQFPPALASQFYDLPNLSKEGFASYFRQLYVNGVRAEIARSNDFQISSRKDWWDDANTDEPRDGIYLPKKNYTNPEDIHIVWYKYFKALDTPAAGLVTPAPDNPNEMVLRMKQPDFLICSSWEPIKPNAQFFIVNALEELDEPGEWYFDQKKEQVYYYPCKRDGDLNQAEVYAPRVEGLLRISGTSLTRVQNLRFEGITFEHGNWTDPKDHYTGMSQAEAHRTYTSEIPGQIVFNYANHVTLSGCTVRHMGSCGIQLYEGCDHVTIEGNTTYDTTAAGITVGRWYFQSKECPPETICTNTLISNNIVRNTGRDYWQGTGINIFTAYECVMDHNDVSDVAYCGFHSRNGNGPFIHPNIGKLTFSHNKASQSFAGHRWGIDDGGQFYTHGRYPDSLYLENYSLHANYDTNLEFYVDGNSHTTRYVRNVSRDTQAGKVYNGYDPSNIGVIFEGNYSDKNNPDPGCVKQIDFHWVQDGKWPEEAQKIMDNAGLEPKWRHLADRIYGHDNLAEGKKCASSSNQDDKQTAEKAVDNDWKAFWRSNPEQTGPAWWSVDLGESYVLQKVGILPIFRGKYEASGRKMLEIQASNDPDFKNHVVLAERTELPWYNISGKGSNYWEQFVGLKQSFRYLRVISTDPKGVLSMGEFFAYGYPAKTP